MAIKYFAFIASKLGRIGLQSRVLRLIRPQELVDKYHYPARYLLNTPYKVRKLGSRYGFEACEFRYSERLDEFSCYFPGPSKSFPWLWEKMVQLTKQERLLGNLMGRMVKAGS